VGETQPQTQTQKPKIRWKLIKVPEETWHAIINIAKGENIASWKVIQRAWTFWYNAYRSHYTKGVPRIDKASWYVFKFSSSIGEFKSRPNDRNLAYVMDNLNFFKTKLGLDTSAVELAVQQYKAKRTPKNKASLNDASKLLVSDIIAYFMKQEEQQNGR
jgi:hypothetical protein